MDLLFWYCKSKTQGHGTIKVSVQIEGYPESNLTTSIKVAREEWGGDRLRFVGKSEWVKLRNAQLRKLESDLEKLATFLEATGVTLTPKLITDTFKGMDGLSFTLENVFSAMNRKQKIQLNVMELLKWYMERKRKSITESTYSTYERRFKNFQRFFDENKSIPQRCELLTPDYIYRFCDWLRDRDNKTGTGSKIGQNYLYKHILFLTDAYNQGFKRKLIRVNPLAGFGVGKEETKDLRHLSPKDLLRMEAMSFAKIKDTLLRKQLEEVRDMFVFCCYTGFHFGDRQGLVNQNLEVRGKSVWIFKERQKTGIQAKVKLHPKAIVILKKYNGLENFPKFTNRDNNSLLKIIDAMLELNLGLCTKIARKTFAYMALNVWNIDKDSVAAMMGLKSTKHIADYAEIDENRIDKAVSW